jgi:hypothetical protein
VPKGDSKPVVRKAKRAIFRRKPSDEDGRRSSRGMGGLDGKGEVRLESWGRS